MVVTHQGVWMKFGFQRLALIGGLSLVVYAVLGSQHTRAHSNPPADPQAKITQPATHFTQGTIASIDANNLVIKEKGRGKAGREKVTVNGQTQRNGNLAAGTRVSVQYREQNGQKIAAAVRELTVDTTAKPTKARSKG